MGLIKTGIYAGTAYAIFNKASKAYGQHEQTRGQNQQVQPQQMQFSAPTRQRGVSPSADSGYVHQHYCNGNCSEQCNPTVNAYSAGGSASQYYNNPSQQRSLEQQPEEPPLYDNGRMGKKDFADLASLASGFLKK